MFSLPQPVLSRKAPALVFILALMLAASVSVLWTAASPAGAQDDGSGVPAKPEGLEVSTERGSLDVSVEWDDVDGAASYLVRWRTSDGELNEGVEVETFNAAITVADCCDWGWGWEPTTTPAAR